MDQQENRKNVLSHLGQLGVDYAITEHPAVYTIEEMQNSGIKLVGEVCKNLFLRDSAGKRHFLVTIPGGKKAPLKILQQKLGTSRLSFASEERLARYLKLHQGEVTPFGILNDEGREVELVFDSALEGHPRLGVHPNDNTATVFLKLADLMGLLQGLGSDVALVDLN